MGEGTGSDTVTVLVIGERAETTGAALDGTDGISARDVAEIADAVPLADDVDCIVADGADLAAVHERLRDAGEAVPGVFLVSDTDAVPEAVAEDSFVTCCPASAGAGFVASSVRTLVAYRRTHEDRRRKDRALDQAPVGITISDPDRPDNPVIYANEGFDRLTGYPVEKVVGRNCRFLQGPDTDQETVDELGAAIEAERDVEVDIRNYRRDGTPFWNHLAVSPVYDDGTLVNYVGYQKDVTDRVMAERRLRAQNERLEVVASVMSHDVRNPLNVAQGLVQLGLAGEDPDWDAIAESLSRIDDIIEDALVLARGDPGSVTAVDLAAVSRRAWAGVEVSGLSLSTDGDRSFVADESLLQQLLENLFRNADEHADATEVRVGPTDAGFYVEDDGTGIPDDQREAVFAPGHTTTASGTGLGLAIVKRIADVHGWTVTLSASAEGGARFELTGVETTVS
jgi:PAS domain S-box-containing protein